MTSSYDSREFQLKSKLQKLMLRKNTFAHHPNCNLYDYHVFHIGEWRLCAGCSGLYSGIISFFIADILFLHNLLSANSLIRWIIASIFFIPALIQLRWKSHKKWVKFVMRYSLGIAAYLYLTSIFFAPLWWQKIIDTIVYIGAIILYSRKQAAKALIECINCKNNQEFSTCLIKFEHILAIDGIEEIRGHFAHLDNILLLRDQKASGQIPELKVNIFNQG